jgi:hypothetical protein
MALEQNHELVRRILSSRGMQANDREHQIKQKMAEFRKRNIRAKRTILDAVKDHVIPHVSGKDFTFQMWQSLCGLYQSPNQNRKMVLQEKLRGTKMTKTDSVTSFLTRFSQIRDELAAVGEIVDPSELVRTTLRS